MRRQKSSLMLVGFSMLFGCGQQLVQFPLDEEGMSSPTPTPEEEVTATPSETAVPTGTPSSSPTPHLTPSPTASPSPSPTASPSPTPVPVEPPTVLSTVPDDEAGGVSVNQIIEAVFSTDMDPDTIGNTRFIVQRDTTVIPGEVSYDESSATASFTPDSFLEVDSIYTVTLSVGITDLDGNSLEEDYVWQFSTGACSLAPVALGSSNTYALLAGSTITNIGATVITGDVGVSPGTAITGFPPGTIVGAQHLGDVVSAEANADLTTAYQDAAGRSLCSVSVAGNIGGTTLTPGLYTSTSSLAISSGNLTLDAQGDSSAVFIFQIASTLTTTSGRRVILSGGALASNVYWQVGTSATFGTTSVFQGTVMADQSITMETGATLNGRLLARIGAIALDTNTVTVPAL